jgi:hypothetical protein
VKINGYNFRKNSENQIPNQYKPKCRIHQGCLTKMKGIASILVTGTAKNLIHDVDNDDELVYLRLLQKLYIGSITTSYRRRKFVTLVRPYTFQL